MKTGLSSKTGKTEAGPLPPTQAGERSKDNLRCLNATNVLVLKSVSLGRYREDRKSPQSNVQRQEHVSSAVRESVCVSACMCAGVPGSALYVLLMKHKCFLVVVKQTKQLL